MAGRRRLDAELVRRGLAGSRAEARTVVEAGRVTVAGAPALKVTRLVAPDEALELLGPPPRFVSRGGEKLDAALDRFGVDVAGRRVLDAGASTGGFTDCVLQRGAAQVVAVDVGHGQLHERLRADPRVDNRERTNIRSLDADDLGGPVDVTVADLSFISLRTVLPALLACSRPGADLVLLVKPQFEAGRAEATRGRGVIRDPAVHERVQAEVAGALDAAGASIMGWMDSPLLGADGNRELLVHARAPGGWVMSLVVLVAHHGRPDAAVLAHVAVDWLTAHGHESCLLEDDAVAVGLASLGVTADVVEAADLAVSLGGDGTVLRTVELVSAKGVPIIAVNVGLLGYLTEVEPQQLVSSLERFFAGDHELEERMMLAVTGPDGTTWRALNEAVVEKRSSGHTVRLLVRIDGVVFTTYAADGLIVATPTGSTAYSLSARGPIVSPAHRALLLTPVSPHMLFDRSLVLDPHETVEIEVIGDRQAELSLDGRHVGVVAPGEAVACRAADEVARFVRLGERSFHRILKAKFGLSDR